MSKHQSSLKIKEKKKVIHEPNSMFYELTAHSNKDQLIAPFNYSNKIRSNSFLAVSAAISRWNFRQMRLLCSWQLTNRSLWGESSIKPYSKVFMFICTNFTHKASSLGLLNFKGRGKKIRSNSKIISCKFMVAKYLNS